MTENPYISVYYVTSERFIELFHSNTITNTVFGNTMPRL